MEKPPNKLYLPVDAKCGIIAASDGFCTFVKPIHGRLDHPYRPGPLCGGARIREWPFFCISGFAARLSKPARELPIFHQKETFL